MYFYKIIIIVLLFLNISGYSFAEIKEGARDRVKLNGAQVFVFDASYKNDVGAFFEEAKAKGVDTVFVRVFHNEGDRPHFQMQLNCSSGVYFKTDSACVAGDILGQIAQAAHMNGIKIFAWMATRSLSFLKTPENMASSFLPEGGTGNGYGANIFKPNVREDIINLFKDLAAYDIDGILFQDDFIIKYSEGADDYAASLFEAETGLRCRAETFFNGTKVIDGKKMFTGFKEEFYTWARWKNYHLSGFFNEIRRSVLSVNPDILLAANVYYETPILPNQALAWYSQELGSLEKAGADYYAVMGYSEQIGAEQKLDINSTAAFIGGITAAIIAKVQDPARVIMKLQGRNFKGDRSVIPNQEFRKICNAVEKEGDVSVAVVPVFSSGDIKTCDFSKE